MAWSVRGRSSEQRGRRKKGVSPLIAAVLLIAFTMAVAAILTAWVTQFTQEQTGAVSNQSDNLIQCSYAQISIYAANLNNASDSLDVTVANTGTVNLGNVSVYSFKDAITRNKTFIPALEAGSLKTGTIIYTLNEKPDKVRVTSKECPSASDEEDQITIS